jgi:hypothetical protein
MRESAIPEESPAEPLTPRGGSLLSHWDAQSASNCERCRRTPMCRIISARFFNIALLLIFGCGDAGPQLLIQILWYSCQVTPSTLSAARLKDIVALPQQLDRDNDTSRQHKDLALHQWNHGQQRKFQQCNHWGTTRRPLPRRVGM